jgi:cytochrome b6-f complex iron-sulfur subunit
MQQIAGGFSDSSRRGFFSTLFGLLSFLGLGGIGYVLGKFLYPLRSAGGENIAQIPSSEIAEWGSKVVLVGGKPVVIVRAGNEIKALSAVCTHLGCIVKFDPSLKIFICPCHGAKYDLTGKVLGGPAPAPLLAVKAHEESGKVIVG